MAEHKKNKRESNREKHENKKKESNDKKRQHDSWVSRSNNNKKK
jgi:hypothetical protein